MTDTTEPIEVVSPLVAGMLAGVSTEAVRQAVAQGRVRVRAELAVSGRVIRLLDLASVLGCWSLDRLAIEADMNLRLVHSAVIEGPYSRFRVLAPSMWLPVVTEEPPDAETWHAKAGLWPTWSRG